MRVLAIAQDLLAEGRVRALAENANIPFVGVADAAALAAAVQQGDVVAVDLDRTDAVEAIRGAKAKGATVVAHGSHADAERLRAARLEGAAAVPNSQLDLALVAALRL